MRTYKALLHGDRLEKLAARGTFAASTDPVRWQRELRQDRVLLGCTQ